MVIQKGGLKEEWNKVVEKIKIALMKMEKRKEKRKAELWNKDSAVKKKVRKELNRSRIGDRDKEKYRKFKQEYGCIRGKRRKRTRSGKRE